MVGLCGILGGETESIDHLAEALRVSDSQERCVFRDEVALGYCDHGIDFEQQPATTGGVSIWCWGELLGHEWKDDYVRRSDGPTDAEYCAKLYDRYGLNFVAGLNSEFAGIAFDREDGVVSLFTDRLGSRPIYYTKTDSGGVVFSSLLQSLATHPDVTLDVDPSFLSEFLTYGRSFGVHTPAAGVRAVPPGSVITFDLDGSLVDTWRYWWPSPRRRDVSSTAFVDRLERTVRRAVLERVDRDREHGLLLSGGSDSRLLLDALAPDVTAFHMNERLERDREAETARRVARESDAEFRFLRRDISYYPDVLERSSSFTNFNGLFRHAHALGFAEEISEHVDGVFCGHYSDVILGATYVPKRTPSPRVLRHVVPPRSARSVGSTGEYSAAMNDGAIGEYNPSASRITHLPETASVFEDHVRPLEGAIESHGVHYPDWTSLTEFGMVHPITNTRTFIFYETLCQMLPTHYPFLDNRVVELALEMPRRYWYRGDVVDAALTRANPTLASIPHPGYRLPISYPYLLKDWLQKAIVLSRNIPAPRRPAGPDSSVSESAEFHNQGSWPDHAALIRRHPFIEEVLRQHEERVRDSPYLDYDDIVSVYREHLDGVDHTDLLYGIATVLESLLDLG